MNGALGEHRRHDTDGIKLEIRGAGCNFAASGQRNHQCHKPSIRAMMTADAIVAANEITAIINAIVALLCARSAASACRSADLAARSAATEARSAAAAACSAAPVRSCAPRFGPMCGYSGGSFAGACPGAGGC